MKKGIPLGIKNYRELKEKNYYVVDKSLLIQEFLERMAKATLVTRPRRFGKTLNMSMLAEFFDITKDSKEIFADTAIMKTKYVEHMNSYPTIFLSFADAKDSKNRIVACVKEQLLKVYDQYSFTLGNLNIFEKPKFDSILKGLSNLDDGNLETVDRAISFLMTKCHQYYGKRVMLFIDEYDTPFIEAHTRGFYEDVRGSFAAMLHASLKSSDDLEYAMLTGIQRVAKENIFSDLNNIFVCTVKDSDYASYFGFTEDEVKKMLVDNEMEYIADVKKMYDGYNMGGIDIYNPWSIVNYVCKKVLAPYWINTSSNTMIKEAMQCSEQDFKDDYEKLIKTGTVETLVNFETSFYELKNTSSLWGLFVNAGYLTINKTLDVLEGIYSLRIPNNEVAREFQSLTVFFLNVDETTVAKMFQALKTQSWNEFLKNYQRMLLESVSYYDLRNENSYHSLLLGMCMWLRNDYEIISNRESGEGRFDILLNSKNNALPSMLFELKYTKDENVNLEELAEAGMEQIKKKKYGIGMENCVYIALAHCGKRVYMCRE